MSSNTIKIKAGSGTPTTSDIQDKELAFDRSADKLYINDAGSIVDLTGSASLDTEAVQDIVGAMFTSNTETRISATYQDGDGTIDLVVDDMTADTNTQLSTEEVQDIVGAMFSSNTETGIDVSYVDGDGTIDLTVDYLPATDDRDVKPNAITTSGVKQVRAYFTTLEGLTGSSGNDYQDLLVLDTYSDGTGGDANALAFDKSEQKIRHYLADQSDTTWGTAKVLAYEDTFSAGTNLTLSGTTFNVDDAFLKNDADDTTSGTVTGAGFNATNYFQINKTGSTGSLLKLVNSGWSNATTHDIIYNSYLSNLGDFTYLKSAGNSTTGHGIAMVADHVFAVGDTSSETGNPDNDAADPFTDTWFTVDGSGNGVFKGTVTATDLDISGDVDVDGTLETDALTINGTASVAFTSSDHSKLDGIASGATANTGTVTAANGSDNRIATFSSSTALNGESNLTFNGHLLTVSGDNANGINMDADGSTTSNSERIFFTGTSTSAIFQSGSVLSFRTGATAGSSSGTERMHIDTSGIDVNGSVIADSLDISGDIDVDGTANFDAIDLDGNLDMRADDVDAARYIHMPRGGGITFYGDASQHHGIFSRNDSNTTAQDDILITSYGAVYIDLDSNDNNTSNASFEIGKHNTANDPLFVVDGEDGQIRAEDGSASAPVYSFNADDNCGMFRVSSDVVGIAAAGNSRFTVKGNGIKAVSGSLGVNTDPNSTDGMIHATNDIVAFSSDKRLKENIRPIENALDKVSKLSGFVYNWNELANEKAEYNMDKDYVGVYAQDVEKVQPEAVDLAPFDNDGEDNSISGEKYLTVQYEKLVPLLIEAIKQLKEEVEELKK